MLKLPSLPQGPIYDIDSTIKMASSDSLDVDAQIVVNLSGSTSVLNNITESIAKGNRWVDPYL